GGVRAHGQPGHQGRRARRPLFRARAAHRSVQGRHHPPRRGAGHRLRAHPLLLRPRGRARLRPLRLVPPAPEGLRRGGRARPDALRRARMKRRIAALAMLTLIAALAIALRATQTWATSWAGERLVPYDTDPYFQLRRLELLRAGDFPPGVGDRFV